MDILITVIGCAVMAVVLYGGMGMIAFKTHDIQQGIDQAHRERKEIMTAGSAEYLRAEAEHRKNNHNVDLLGSSALIIFLILFCIIIFGILGL
jgi:hypothetical protein